MRRTFLICSVVVAGVLVYLLMTTNVKYYAQVGWDQVQEWSSSKLPASVHVSAAKAKLAECRKQLRGKLESLESQGAIVAYRSSLENIGKNREVLERQLAKAKLVQVSWADTSLSSEQQERLIREISQLKKSYKEVCAEEQEIQTRLDQSLQIRSQAIGKYRQLLTQLDLAELRLGEMETDYALQSAMRMVKEVSQSMSEFRHEDDVLNSLRRTISE